MLQNVFQIKADLKKKSTFVATPEIVQNDNVRFEIEVTDNGKPLALDNVQTVSLAHSTKGETVVTSGEIEGNKVIFNLGTLETKYVGQVNATVQLYDAEGRISTIKFPYYVVADPTGKDYVPSEKEQTLIEVVMAEAQAKIDELSQVDVVDLKAKQDEFTVQLAQTLNKKDYPSNKLSADLARILQEPIPMPENFQWNFVPINIYRTADGAVTDFDISQHIPSLSGQTYYVSMTGDDNNDGLSPSTSLRSVNVARLKSDVAQIIVGEGVYDDMYAFNNATASGSQKSLIIKAEEGADVVLSTRRKLGFYKTDGYNNVYERNRTLVASVYDSKFESEWGDMLKFEEVESIEECDATPGSMFYDGTTLYIHRLDSSDPSNGEEIFIFLDVLNFNNVGNYTVYFENIKFWGGKDGAVNLSKSTGSDMPRLIAKNCEFSYSSGGDGGVEQRGGNVILENCVASSNFADGFNYHSQAGQAPDVIEIDCKGFGNGIGRGTDTDNGSTMHNGGKIIRLNCEYYMNEGPNVHDINADTQAWVINSDSHNSLATTSARQSNYRVEDNAAMWLDNCKGYDSDGQLYVGSDCSMAIKKSELLDGVSDIRGVLMEY